MPAKAEGCTCLEGGAAEHVCPYDEDVHNDPDSVCACCPACTQECINDI